MKAKMIVLIVMFGLIFPALTMATGDQLTTEVPKYSQNNFNNNIPGYSDPGEQDCVPTSVGMVFGYFYRKFQSSGNYNGSRLDT